MELAAAYGHVGWTAWQWLAAGVALKKQLRSSQSSYKLRKLSGGGANGPGPGGREGMYYTCIAYGPEVGGLPPPGPRGLLTRWMGGRLPMET